MYIKFKYNLSFFSNMKHTIKITIILLLIFSFSQLFGLFTLNKDLKITTNNLGKVENISYSEPIIGERPTVQSNTAFIYVLFAVLIGTIILLFLIKFKQVKVWKTWFFLAVFMSISVALGVYFSKIYAFIFAFIIAVFKIFKPNFYLQNISEILIYTGIALLFVPLFNVFWMAMLLLAISLYDAYAVWHSKHMVKMANFQTEAKLFAGLSVPYNIKESGKSEIKLSIPKSENFKTKIEKNIKVDNNGRMAILGGGDIAFPLLFSGAVMQSLIINGATKMQAFLQVQIVVLFSAIALFGLFIYGRKDRFYPAMPFISAGCFIGYGLLLLFQLIL